MESKPVAVFSVTYFFGKPESAAMSHDMNRENEH